MVRKAVLLLIPLAAAGIAASQWQDITRYLKIKQMSRGNGHPENVPAGSCRPTRSRRLLRQPRGLLLPGRTPP